jgi:acetyl-CoA C-acetyltransferase
MAEEIVPVDDWA